MRWTFSAIALVLIGATIPSAAAPRTDQRSEAAAAEKPALLQLDVLARRLTAKDKFSGVILIARGGKSILQRTYGLADREKHVRIRPDTRFYLGSANKMFTAVAVLQLVAAGRLSLDDTVEKVLPDYPNRDVARKVTVRHLLAHTSGLAEVDIFADRERTRELQDYIALYGSTGLTSEPGSTGGYSNFGFIILGAMVERLSGQKYRDYVAEHIFKPAGMTASDFPTRNERSPDLAVGYTRRWPDSSKVTPLQPHGTSLPWRGTSAGGGASNAPDLLRFINMVKSGKLVDPGLFAQAIKPQSSTAALGFQALGDGPRFQWGHGGGAWGMNTEIRHYPKGDLTVIVLANRDPNVAYNLVSYYEYSRFDPTGSTPLFLRGSMNEWSTANPLRPAGKDSRSTELSLRAGTYQLKVASEDWKTVDLGTSEPVKMAPEGAPVELQFLGSNIDLAITEPGKYRFTLTGFRAGEPTLSIRRAQD